ncbi:DUF1641 domain-containing protein [Thermaerobacter sp. PB12/4term]|uniref:DUF1641 domain-containing protein n=1 Tax=Thermaerobacter sp. PB12/4term TaxID=2293838 RepID=UPI000E32C702|nr:DUF1641 domain-containing protein [Thermaerobacter sp. PB12/4term]QIA27592.1 DUF1641 domain-containing protein [Thermaerobacter sp. PB12/4term]
MAAVAERTREEHPLEQQLMERLADPRTMELLLRLLDKLDQLVFLLEMVEQFLRRGPEIADSINETIITLRKNLGAGQARAPWEDLSSALSGVKEVIESPQVQALFRSAVLDTRSVAVVGHMARAMVEASEQVSRAETKRVGLVGLLRALGDADVQPALQFALAFAQSFSRELAERGNGAQGNGLQGNGAQRHGAQRNGARLL